MVCLLGHNELDDSKNPKKFRELLIFLEDNNETIKTNIFKDAPQNLQCTSSDTQTQIINACIIEIINIIIEEACQ